MFIFVIPLLEFFALPLSRVTTLPPRSNLNPISNILFTRFINRWATLLLLVCFSFKKCYESWTSLNYSLLFFKMQSGHIYFYNTRTQKRTSRDPRLSTTPEPPTPVHMSLDLELNLLPCGSLEKTQNSYFIGNNKNSDTKKNSTEAQGLITRSPSWLTFDVDQQEMVTAVCKKCHMLVMMSTSSPTCPNCKFVNPPDETPPTLFKRRLSSF